MPVSALVLCARLSCPTCQQPELCEKRKRLEAAQVPSRFQLLSDFDALSPEAQVLACAHVRQLRKADGG